MSATLELGGAPLFWGFVSAIGLSLLIPGIVLGARRRLESVPRSFWVQRAPQLAFGLGLGLLMPAFEVIEVALGTGRSALPMAWVQSMAATPLVTVAHLFPPALAAAISWCGVAIALSGLVFANAGVYWLGRSFTTDVGVVAGHRLQTRGPFRLVMHPVYSGYVQFFAGSALVVLSPLSLAFTVLVLAPLFLRRALREEAMLRARFGAPYLEWAGSVRWRRLLPTFSPISP